MKTNTEFLRLVNNDPLVLAVSALSDFLWDDFIRDARPIVKYIEDRYNIRQLSRFGKELFDFLYNGGQVTTVITLDEAETYFRAKQNGQNPELPKNYKPEYAFWVNLFIQICESPAWPRLVSLSVGDQFTAGNNAINVLNELSEVIDKQIEQGFIDAHMLADAGQELQNIREQFMQAKARGDLAKAAELRQKGKELGQQIEQAMQEAAENMQPQVGKAVDRAHQTAKDVQDAMSQLAGSEAGKGLALNDIAQKRNLARKLSANPGLRELVRRLGAFRQAWADRKRARKGRSNYSDIVGAKFSDEVIKAFPAEIALAATEHGRALFALKYSQKTLLTKDYEAKIKELDKGPVVMYIDISGSMAGESELWSKALAYVVAEECLKQNRATHIHLFDTVIQKSIHLDKNRSDNERLLNFVLSWTTRGGTSFCSVIDHALSKVNHVDKADILMITDGNAEVSDPFIRRLNAFKQEHGVQWNSFCIGKKSRVLSQFSDAVHTVDPSDDFSSAELFQNALN
jgi:uncharacterized protein with von Willebrand factor type A (vWA) domain